MSSSSVSNRAAPWRGASAVTRERARAAPVPVARLRVGCGPLSDVVGAAGLLALWVVVWSFFILGVAAPAATLHRASANASQAVTAVATAGPQGDRGR